MLTRASLVALTLAALAVLTGCASSVDTSAVPTEAGAEALCPGMPADGALLMTGRDELTPTTQVGVWNEGRYLCAVSADATGTPLLIVERDDVTQLAFVDDGQAIEAWLGEAEPREIEVDGTVFGAAYDVAGGDA